MTVETAGGPRASQRLRTRRDLLEAAARLMREGRTPTFEEVAEAAQVSRATAYRYFPGLEALLLEAGLHVATPTAEAVFSAASPADPLDRLMLLDDVLHRMVAENEASLRVMLAQSLQRSIAPDADPAAPVRQNRRSPLVSAALEPARDEFSAPAFDNLSKAVVLLLGIEAVVVFKDVLRLAPDEAERVRRWALKALVDAARKASCRTD